jgi:hypothetical protein
MRATDWPESAVTDVIPTSARPPRALLIMGSPRSGTTLLAQLVNRFFDVHICRDNGTLLRFHRVLHRYEPLGEDANLRRLIGHLYRDYYFRERLLARGLSLSEDELLGRVGSRTYGGLIDAIFSAVAQAHGKRAWGYKRASFARVEGRHIDTLFPHARFVHMVRDARDVVLSMRSSTDLLLERSWHFAALDWVSHVEAGRRIGAELGPDRYLEVRYERFMAEPADVLAEILAFAGGADGEGGRARLARIRRDVAGLVRSENTGKWRQQVPPPALRTIERVAGPLLAELGYPVLNPGIAGRTVSTPELVWLQADRLVRNILQTRLGVLLRYRLEVLKGYLRAWLGRARHG